MRAQYFNIGAYLAALVALVDQASKWWILTDLLAQKRILHVTDYLNFRLSWNKGVTFGLLNQNNEWAPYILSGLAALIVFLLLNWLRRAETLFAGLGLGFIIGGAIGNVIDRLRFGSVVDFLDFHVMGYHWYTFNLADSAIFCGVVCLLLENLVIRHKSR